jgi:hypothetical protein
MMSQATAPSAQEIVEQRLRDLKVTLDGNISYRLESLFPKLRGWGSNGEIKRRGKLVGLIEPTLTRMLLSGEEVLYVVKGVQHSLAEHYFMGAIWASLLNQRVIVFTNVRMLMLQSNSRGKPSHMFWVIYYSEIQDLKASWFGTVKLKLKDAKNLTFKGVSSLDRKSMPAIFQQSLANYIRHDFTPMTSQSRENLCGHCYKVVSKGDFDCDQCGAEYWSPRQLGLRSLIFPSWGAICMKHYGRASFELVFYLLSWGRAAAQLGGGDPSVGWVSVAMIFLLEHPLDAILTYCIASKGLNRRRDPDPDRVSGTADREGENDDVENDFHGDPMEEDLPNVSSSRHRD